MEGGRRKDDFLRDAERSSIPSLGWRAYDARHLRHVLQAIGGFVEPESWTVIGTGIVILIAIAASNRSLRQEFNTRFKHLEEEIKRIDGDLKRLELEMRERLARLEGLFEGMRETILERTTR